MGWDAYATKAGEDLDRYWHHDQADREPELVDPALRAAFEVAATEARQLGGSTDWLLSIGGLDVSTCGEKLSAAVGRSVYDEDGWTPEEVKEMASSADWKATDVQPAWAYWSARKFLETCAAHNLGIRFSW